MSKKAGTVYITGAGCAAADLITLRGLNAIRTADVIIYDELISHELLSYADVNAELICMGKRGGKKSAPQDDINACIAQYALQGKQVCRLKGGDPLVFGRGGEEALYLQQMDIPYEIIPGISSSIAVPSLAGIPVTHRSTSRSFHVITAHTADSAEPLGENASVYARLPGTLIFLMGRSSLPRLSAQLINAGKDPLTPAAVISAAEGEKPLIAKAPLHAIASEADRCGIPSPAVILVGTTAELDLCSPTLLPLAGKKIAVTGSPKIYDTLFSRLSALGAEVLPAGQYALKDLPCSFSWERLEKGGWLVFTSANGVHSFFRKFFSSGHDLRLLSRCFFAVIGASTGSALMEHGFKADLCPEEYTTSALAQALLPRLDPQVSVYLFRSVKGNPEFFSILAAKATVEDIALYDMVNESPFCREIHSADCICFSSAAGAQMFAERYGTSFPNACCICIGEPTAKAASSLGFTHIHKADKISASAMVEKILSLFATD